MTRDHTAHAHGWHGARTHTTGPTRKYVSNQQNFQGTFSWEVASLESSTSPSQDSTLMDKLSGLWGENGAA